MYITDDSVQVTDGDTAPYDIVFTLVDLPTQGSIYKDGQLLRKGDTFTQADVNSGNNLLYRHSEKYIDSAISEVTDSIRVSISDGHHILDQTMSIRIKNLQEPPPPAPPPPNPPPPFPP